MENTVKICNRINPKLKESLTKFCIQNGMTQERAVESALEILLLGQNADHFPDVKSDIDSVISCTEMIIKHYNHMMNKYVNEKRLSAEMRKTVASEMDEKIKQLEDNLRKTENQAEEYRRRAENESIRANRCENDKQRTVDKLNNMEERQDILLKKIKDLEEKATLVNILEKEINELKDKAEKANESSRQMSMNMAEMTKMYFANKDDKDHMIEKLQTYIEILRIQLKKAGITPAEMDTEYVCP